MLLFFPQRKQKSPRHTASGTNKHDPRYHPNYLKRDLFTLQQALSLNAGRRDALLSLAFHTTDSGIRSSFASLPVLTTHRLSGRTSQKTNFPSKSFSVLLTFKHTRTGLSMFFCPLKKILCEGEKHLTFWCGHVTVGAIFQKALTKTVRKSGFAESWR